MIVHKLSSTTLRTITFSSKSHQAQALSSQNFGFHHVFHPFISSTVPTPHKSGQLSQLNLTHKSTFTSSTFLSSLGDNKARSKWGQDEPFAENSSSGSDSNLENSRAPGLDSDVRSNQVDEGPYTMSPEEMKEIAGDDQEIEKKIQFILMEHELLRQEGVRVPITILKKNWPELLGLRSKSQRMKFYNYLWNIERAKESDQRKKEARKLERLQQYAQNPLPTLAEDPYCMTYGLNRNTLFLRLYDSKIITFQSHKIISEMVLGTPPLIIDCGYDDQMVFRESKNCSDQLEMGITENRVHPQPFNLTFCNANPKSNMMKELLKRIPTLYSDDYALNVTEKSYLDLYPREKIVYLSPHARDEMTAFDHDKIYIIGAIVDKSDPRPFSMAKAKKEGIRLEKLPLDTRLDWGWGNKSLTINQLISIMLEIRATGDWDRALRFIPKRKLMGGRTECPLRGEIPGGQQRPRPGGHAYSQVFKDFELVAQRRRGFQYEGEQQEDSGQDRGHGDGLSQQRRGFGRQKVGIIGTQPAFVKRNMRTILSDSDS